MKYLFKYKNQTNKHMHTFGNRHDIIEKCRKNALANYKDSGTCVLGMHLRYKGIKIADQLWQGNMPNYQYFEDIKQALITELNYQESEFYIEHGNMD